MKNLEFNINEIVINPITTQTEFNQASELIEVLMDADLIEDEILRNKALNILEAVTVLAVDYEKKSFPIEKLDPIEAIKQRIEMLNLSQKEIASFFGGENRVSEVLNKKRPLTLKMVKNLYHGLGISADVLLALS